MEEKKEFWESKIQVFSEGIKNTKVLREASLRDFLEEVKNTPDDLKKVFNNLYIATSEGNEKRRGEIKQKELPFYTLSVRVREGGVRNYESITSFNPVLVAEYDGIAPHVAVKLKYSIFYGLPSCAMAWISPSGHGVKFLIRIPKVSTIDEYKEYFYGVASVLNDGEAFDRSNVNCILPLFLSQDPKALYRERPLEFKIRARDRNAFTELSSEELEKLMEDREEIPSEEHGKAFRKINRMITSIEGNGYPQVRGAAVLAGGYFAYGYGDKDVWIDLMDKLVRENEYLTSGGDGKLDAYLKVIRSGFNYGMKSPLKY